MSRKIHPAADVWPMMSQDELEALAADIKANGLRQKVVVDGSGVVLDGRNRLAACEIADVEPTFTILENADPVAFVLSCNSHRRHISKGQKAMAGVLTLMNNSSNQRESASKIGVDQAQVGWARRVAADAPDLVDLVLDGTRSLKDAYDEARRRSDEANNEANRAKRLRDEAPDLADMMTDSDGQFTLSQAEASLAQRRKDEADLRRDLRKNLNSIVDLAAPSDIDPDYAKHWAEGMDLSNPDDPDTTKLGERLDRAIETLTALREEIAS